MILSTGGVCAVTGWGSVHGCRGACVVVGGYVWLLGGMRGCQGACVVAGGVSGGGCAWLPGGHAWDTMRYGQ